jgi:allantoinase
VVPGNSHAVQPLLDSGIYGLKAFLIHSGIDEFPNVAIEDLHRVMPLLKEYGLPLLVHAELYESGCDQSLTASPSSYQAWIRSRPNRWEDQAIRMMISLCEKYHCKTHIVHLSSASALDHIRTAKKKGLPLTVETCPHYLYFNAEDIPDGNTLFKCAPPIREKANNELLLQALKDKLIDMVVTDHSPSIPDLKEIQSGNLKKAWGGIASLQFSLPVFWTKARTCGFDITDIERLMCRNTSRLAGIDSRKGCLEPGFDADITVWDPDASFVVSEELIQHRHTITPYLGETLYGVVKQTYVGGRKVYDCRKFTSSPCGEIMRHSTFNV